MEDKRITAEEILAEIDIDVKQMAQNVLVKRQWNHCKRLNFQRF